MHGTVLTFFSNYEYMEKVYKFTLILFAENLYAKLEQSVN